MTTPSSAFALPDRLAAKRTERLIAADDAHFSAIAESLEASIADLETRLDNERRAPGRSGQDALERDLEIHRLTSRLRTIRRFGIDLCLGRIVPTDAAEPTYIGRLGLTAPDGRRLLVDWRSPAAEPFFGATHANPDGLASRRRYRWTGKRITDYWDEVFTAGGLESTAVESRATLDDQSAFIASLGSNRSPRMRDVLGTIQSDQDAVIRAGSHGALVVDGGPGTGKTVVALHRAAYLLYADARIRQHRGGILVVGPHEPYLAYVADVLPSLGEEGVMTATLRDLVPEGATSGPEQDERVVALKSTARMVEAIDAAVRVFEEPPQRGIEVETPWGDLWVSPADWTEAFSFPQPGTPHNDARDQVFDELLSILTDRLGEDVPLEQARRSLVHNDELVATFSKAWPVLEASQVVGYLFAVPALLRRCAPWLTPNEIALLQRPEHSPWTESDLPLLDAARLRIGDPEQSRRRRRRESTLARQREQMERVIDDLIQAEELDDGEGLMTMLRGEDVAVSLMDESSVVGSDVDRLAGPFAHIVVDEAQELTDAAWQMLLARCPSRSFTVVGDRAQARHGFSESWEQRLERAGLDRVSVSSLTVNYRTPEEVMVEAAPVIRSALPDANVPISIRSNGVPVRYGVASELRRILDEWLASNDEGIACVIGESTFADEPRVRSLTPTSSKGLEFDLVILVDPDSFGDGIAGAVDRYVAMTRATQRLVVLSSRSEV